MQNCWTLTAIILTIKLLSAYAADNEIPTECPQVGPINTTILIAHELDCTKFYSCSNGRKILMMCPLMDGAGNRLHFNPKLQVCDWPNHAGCNVSASTTAIPTTESTSVGTNNSTEWVVTTESTEANNSSEITETTTEIITESSEESTVAVSSGSNSTISEATITSTSPTVHETESTSGLPESTSVTTQKPLVPSSTVKETQPSITTQSTIHETESTSRLPESTSVTTQKPLVPSSTVTEAQPSVTNQSTVHETESTSKPSESTSPKTEQTASISSTVTISGETTTHPTEITSQSSESSTFLTSSTPQITTINQTKTTTTTQITTNQTETTTTTQITTTNPTIITTDDFDSNEITSTLSTPLPKCTSNVSGVLYPHESDCSLFYICDHGKLVLLSCAQGLYFDEPRQICVWPYETNCRQSTSLNPSTTISTTSSSTTTSANISELCPTDNSNNGVLYPHECVCSKFYVCNNGQLVLNQCPNGLNFNPNLNVCDWSENFQCQSSSSLVSSTTQVSTTSIPIVETIKPIEPNSTGSSNLIDQSTVSKSECPEDGSESQLPHETNCRLYYECIDGKKWLKECSSGLEFNPSLQFCDRPELAGCSNSESNQGTTVGKIETSTPISESTITVSEAVTSVVESSTSKNESSVPVESSTSSVIVSSTLSSDKCLNKCPKNDPIDYTVLIENENCSKFCKCSHGIPYVFNCPAGLHFNSLKQTCDYPQRANCTRQQA